MQENQNETEVRTEPIIGKFKPKRKFLNFVSAVNGSRVRFIRDIAFIKGDKLSGVLDGVTFKVTICDEGTINFEEQLGSNLTDDAMIKRLISDIDERDVTGYAQKFIVSGLEFSDIDGNLCYLEVYHEKPINRLKSLFEESNQNYPKGLSILDSLFSDTDEKEEINLTENDLEVIVNEIETPSKPSENLKSASELYMEEQFRKMNEAKILELEYRIEETQKEIIRFNNDAKTAEKKAEEKSEALGVLETRLETMKPNEEPNGYVFFVSEEQKEMESLTEEEQKIALRISEIMKLKGDVIIKILTEGYYKIKIAKVDDITAEKVEVTKEILEKMSFDPMGKMRMETPGEFEYRGKLNWHQLVSKMIRAGFAQEPEFDKLCSSNSYESHEEETETEMNLGGVVIKSDGGFVKMGDGVFGIPPSNSNSEIREVEKSNETSPIESETIKTYNEETTLVVMGTLDHNDNPDVQVNDDYNGFKVIIGDKKVKGSYECDGFISIMTLSEFSKWQLKNSDALEDGYGVESFLLPNFKGDIGVTVEVDGEFTNEFDLSDFLQHQFDGEYGCDVFLTLPEGTEIMKMDDYHRIPVAAMRDIKIDKLIN